ncbi:hmg-y-related protein a [Phtheirospermum japonicum]|uniref:Hmg-y-related protein a n=1 Tax=Phtheirospermum japonicum TaxID=374723 RepID=A0A830C9F7_9LAMI|nr:hmg-y-related protein a [Phtheirospermum japonicum]
MASDELPPYPQMIIEAIDALKQPGGVEKSSISEYIESNYEELPADHADLLTTHLNKMKDSGELSLIDNNYLKPGSNVPPAKRGRGRPPKPKDPLAPTSSVPAGPPRPRGRPPSNTPSAAKKAKTSVGSTGRPRGRPRKVKPQQHVETGVEAGVEA